MAEAWLERMDAFYRDLDSELSGMDANCRGCGRCCRFDEADHVLCASRLERRYFVLAGPPPPDPDASPELLAAGLRCPYQKAGHCQARARRPLGCRLYFCAMSDARAEEQSERWHQRLKRLHDELGEDWDYGPLFPMHEP